MAEGKGILKSLQEKIFQLNKQHFLFGQNDKILVGLSGGPDSVFLLHFLIRFQKRYKFQLGAIHINHMLRGKEAIKDEKFCVDLCSQLGIPVSVVRKNAAAAARREKISVEEAGRVIRYEAFNREMKKRGFNKTATAHTIDDNLESVLLNIFKGTGVEGLRGIAPILGGNIIRPLLLVEKADILRYLDLHSIPYCYDSSNSDTDYQRNFLRLNIIPQIKGGLNSRVAEAVFRLSRITGEFENYIQAQIVNIKLDVLTTGPDGWVLDVRKIESLDPFIKGRVIMGFICENLMSQYSFSDVQSIIKLFGSQKGKTYLLHGRFLFIRDTESVVVRENSGELSNDEICITPGKPGIFKGRKILAESFEGLIEYINKDRNREYIDAAKVKDRLIIREWKKGDSFYPIGLGKLKKISDFLTNEKVASIARARQLVLCDGKDIVWLVGLRLDERYKITESTEKILKLTTE